MCTVCGCGEGQSRLERQATHRHDDGDRADTRHHLREPLAGVAAAPDSEPGAGEEAVHAGLRSARQERLVRVERDILERNDRYAAANRRRFTDCGLFVLNLVSSPGSGKTTLLVRTIERLKGRIPVSVVEGDQQTSHDADRIRACGVPAVQINTGKACHLDAHAVGHAVERLAPGDGGVLLIENVGNLVCPASFDLGEHHKVAILSVTEGEDKPVKYPDMFHAADLVLLNKIDLLPHLDFDVARCIDYARRVKPDIRVLQVSATRGDGMDAWLAWIEAGLGRRIAEPA